MEYSDGTLMAIDANGDEAAAVQHHRTLNRCHRRQYHFGLQLSPNVLLLDAV